MSYINKLFPFLSEGDFVRSAVESVELSDIYCPLDFGDKEDLDSKNSNEQGIVSRDYNFKAYRVLPCSVVILNEREDVIRKIIEGVYGNPVNLNIIEIDYLPVAKRIFVEDVDDNLSAILKVNDSYKKEDVVTDVFINSASNGAKISLDLVKDVKIPSVKNTINFNTFIKNTKIDEDTAFLDDLLKDAEDDKGYTDSLVNSGKDVVYDWLDSYFGLPEGVDMKNGGREVVPLLIGPTAVFKSATIKELCKKHGFRLVDFRVAFTSRLDYSGLFQIGEVDGKKYSYSCPLEELVTCSDGFREYCRRAYDKLNDILSKGYLEEDKVSDGVGVESVRKDLTDEQKAKIQETMSKYKEYMKTPVLFFDEITRCKDNGVNGILVQLLNQKRFNDMTLNGCKFVAATNLNVNEDSAHMRNKDTLDDLYDVNSEIDVAYSNRFIPLVVQPDDVKGRWLEWANSSADRKGKFVKNIHPTVLEFLSKNAHMVYNDKPVLDAIDDGLSDNEVKSQTFPNYRTWDMLSGYLYSIDDEFELDGGKGKKVYRENIVNGLVSNWAGKPFMEFLDRKGYISYKSLPKEKKDPDDVGDFLKSTLASGVPALLIGPSSLGKTSRVHAYMKDVERKTGLKPFLINVNLASKDTVDLMGMPVKQTLVDYVSGGGFEKLELGSVGKELGNIVNEVAGNLDYGMVDSLTLRAPDKTIKDEFNKALKEGREVILFFDECNRCKNPTIMSAMFEAISDYKFANVSFKNYKDKVKIIAACNMSYSGMEQAVSKRGRGDDDSEGYSAAGSLDPALAARFSIYWKKQYDENDVKSWLNFMEDKKNEGAIDGTIVEYFKTLSIEKAIDVIAQVENRTIEKAVPSTRTLFQLSKDIKSMRGKMGPDGFKSSLFNGKLIFSDPGMVNTLFDLRNRLNDSMNSVEDVGNLILNFANQILEDRDTWESYLSGGMVSLDSSGTKNISGDSIMSNIEELTKRLKEYLLKPMDNAARSACRNIMKVIIRMAESISTLDTQIEARREKVFEIYVGKEFAGEFGKYFNNVFGTEVDMDITIEMLKDKSLITPFFRKERILLSKLKGDTDKMVDKMLELSREFLSAHHTSLPPENYAMFISEISKTLPTNDNMGLFLIRSDKSIEDLYLMAEKVGDNWIKGVLSYYPTPVTMKDIENMRLRIGGTSSKTVTGRRSRVL